MAKGVKLSILSSYDKSGTDQAEKALERFARKYGQVDKATKAVTLDETTAQLARQSIAADQLAAKWANAGAALQSAGAAMTTTVTVPLVAAGAASFTLASNFESSMSRVSGALDDPSANMQELSDLALKMGEDTIFGATEAGNAMEELAKGGLTSAQIKGGALESTMALAAAGGLDLATAANTVVQAMGAFGLSAEQAGEAANALAGAAAASSADVSDLAQGLSQVSAQAHSAGWSIQDTTAVLAAFADAGIKGSDAGTSLKTMLQRLSAPTGAAAKQLKSLGIEVRDSDGNMKDATQIAGELSEGLSGLDSATRDAAIQTIFGADASRAALVMMNQGAAGIEKYTAATNDQAAAQRMADSQMGDSAKAIEEMKGAIETAAIRLGTALAPTVTDVAKAVGDAAEAFSGLDEGTQRIIVGAAAAAAALGPVATVAGKVATGGSSLLRLYADLTARMAQNSAAAVGSAAATGRVGTALAGAGAKAKAFATSANLAKAGAVGLGLAVAALAVNYIAQYVQAQEEMKQATDGLRNAQLSSVESARAAGEAMAQLELSYAGATQEADNAAQSTEAALAGYEETARGVAAAQASIDQLRASQASLAAANQEAFSSAYAQAGQLDAYGATIDELANKSGLTAQEQARLKVAVDGLNKACGTSYAVIDAENGVLADQSGQALDTTEAINELIRAKQREAQANALNSAYTDTLKQQQEAAAKLAEAMDRQREAQAQLDQVMESGGEGYEVYKIRLDEANKAVSDAQGLYDAAAASASGYTGQLTLLSMAEQQGEGSNAAWLAGQAQVGAIMTANGQDVSSFAQQLDAAGISASDFAAVLSASGVTLDEVAVAYDGSLTSIASLCLEKGVEIPQSLKDGIISSSPEAANAVGVLKDALVLEMTGGDVKLAAELLGHDIDEGLKAGIEGKGDMPEEAIGTLSQDTIDRAKTEWDSHSPSRVMIKLGGDIAQGLAEGIGQGSSVAMTAMDALSLMLQGALGGLTGSGQAAGLGLTTSFGSGIGFGSPSLLGIVASLALGAASSAKSNANASGAGRTLTSTMQSGIAGSMSLATSAARGVALSSASSAKSSANASGAGRWLSSSFATTINGHAANANATSMGNRASASARKASDASGAGKNLSSSFAGGIDVEAAVNKAAQLARNALQAAKDALGIHSPSKEFTSLGVYSAEGLALGIGKGEGMVADASRSMAEAALVGTESGLALAASSTAGNGSAGSGDVVRLLSEQQGTLVDLLLEVRTLRTTLGQTIKANSGGGGIAFASDNEAARWVKKMVAMNV